MNAKKECYFPGGNTSEGFFSYYNQITDKNNLNKIYTIKGGPGVGKSTLMKQVANAFTKKNLSAVYYHCSSDPSSLDGVLIKEKGLLFVDGTAPHVIDPAYPGALYELVNLADFFDSKKLQKDRNEIVALTDEISGLFKHSYKYLNALKPVYESLNDIYKKALNQKAFDSLICNLDKKITGDKKGSAFKEKKLFLSAITPDGLTNFIDCTINCKKVFILDSDPGDLSFKITEALRDIFKVKSFGIECYYCPVNPDKKIDHIIIPELDTAIISSNKYHPYNNGEIINTKSLYISPLIDRDSVNFDLTLIDTLLNRSVKLLKEAKAAHDVLENYYKSAMDYISLNEFCEKLIKSITC